MTFANRLQTVRLRSDLGQHPPETVKRSQPFASRLSRKNPDHVLDEHFARRPSNLPTPLRVAGGLPTRFRVWAGFSANVWSRSPTAKNAARRVMLRSHPAVVNPDMALSLLGRIWPFFAVRRPSPRSIRLASYDSLSYLSDPLIGRPVVAGSEPYIQSWGRVALGSAVVVQGAGGVSGGRAL